MTVAVIKAGLELTHLARRGIALTPFDAWKAMAGLIAQIEDAIDRASNEAAAHPATPGLPHLLEAVTSATVAATQAALDRNRIAATEAFVRLMNGGYLLWRAVGPGFVPAAPTHWLDQRAPEMLPANVVLLARPLRPAISATPPEAA